MIRRPSVYSSLSLLLAATLAVSSPFPVSAQQNGGPQQPSQSAAAPPFKIVVLEGDGAINNIHQLVNRAISVEVDDTNHNPLSGVSVTFFLPNDGPSGLFPNGSRILTVFTDDHGVATSRSIRFNNQIGIMPIRVVASLFSQTSTVTVNQTNVASSASVRSSYVPAAGGSEMATRGHSHKALFIILGIAAAGAGAGVYFATRKSTPTARISIGSPTVGTP
jgi:hypothetical protein